MLIQFDFMHGIFHVVVGNIGIKQQFDHRIRRHFGLRSVFQRTDRLLQQPAVHFKPDADDVSVLLGTEQITGAADLQVAHGNLETCAQFGEFHDRPQTFFGNFTDHFLRPVGKIGMGKPVGATDASPHLIQLRQPEMVGVINDNRICIGNIQTVFDDAGA